MNKINENKPSKIIGFLELLSGFTVIAIIIFIYTLMSMVSTPNCDNSAILSQIESGASIIMTDWEVTFEGLGGSARECGMRVKLHSGESVNFYYQTKYWGADYFIFGFLRIKPKVHNFRLAS
jgi:hypothetical protein